MANDGPRPENIFSLPRGKYIPPYTIMRYPATQAL